MKTFKIPIAVALVATLSCGFSSTVLSHTEDRKKNHDNKKVTTIIHKLAKSLGGIERLRSVKAQQIVSTGEGFAPEQTYQPDDSPKAVSRYSLSLLRAVTHNQSKAEWALDIAYPFNTQLQYSEIINGQQGAVIGIDSILSIPQQPMQMTRLGARSKHYLMTSPISILLRALENIDSVKYRGKVKVLGRYHYLLSLPVWHQSVNLYIDRETFLPTKFTTLEDDSVYGDALWEVNFEQWGKVQGVSAAFQLQHKLNGKIYHKETRNSVEFLQQVSPSQFTIPTALQSPYDAELFAWGIRSSQWFVRYVQAAIPFDLDQSNPMFTSVQEIAPSVFHIRGATHNSMIIEMKDFLMLVDPVLYERRSQAVIQLAQQRWPNKPIKYVVASHFHHDHIGGIRAYAALGATLIVADVIEDYVEDILQADHSVYPDALHNNQRDIDIIKVDEDEEYIVSDGNIKVRLVDIANRHAVGTLVPFVEHANLIFVADLYNPEVFASSIPLPAAFWAKDLLHSLEIKNMDVQWIAGAHGGVAAYDQLVADVTSLD